MRRLIIFIIILSLLLIINRSYAETDSLIIPLTINDAIRMAIDNNIDIKVENYSRLITDAEINKSMGEFDPNLFAEMHTNHQLSPEISPFASPEIGRSEKETFKIGIEGKFLTGTSYQLDISSIRNETNSRVSTLNPNYTTNLSLSLTQPLLKGFGDEINRKNIVISQNNKKISDYKFKEIIINTVTELQNIYWDLVFSIEDLKVKEESLKLAEEFKKQVKAKLDVGVVPPIELIGADAEVASRKEGVIISSNSVSDTEERLKNFLQIKKGKIQVSTNLQRPSDDGLRLNDYLKIAFSKRADYQNSKIELGNKKVQLNYFDNQIYPSIDLKGSLNFNGISGDAKSVSINGGPFQTSSFDGNYINSLDRLNSGKYNSWDLGVIFTMPIQNSTANANLTQAKIDIDRTLLSIQKIEEDITLQVGITLRKIEMNIKRIEATEYSRKLSEQKLNAEKKRYEVGLSTSINLLQFQRDLTVEKNNELSAMIDYQKSRVELDKITGDTLDKNGIVIKKDSE